MKQPIAGIAGSKPRSAKSDGNGKLSRAELHKLDKEYRIERNQQLELKNEIARLLLEKAQGEQLPRKDVEYGLGFVMVALRSKILVIHNKWAHRLVGLDLATVRETLRELELSLLSELRNLEFVTDLDQLEEEAADLSDNEARDIDEKLEMPKRETVVRKKAKQAHHG